MKKFLKITLTIVLVIVLLLVALIVILFMMSAEKSKHYYKYTNAKAEIEKKYSAMGDFEVTSHEYSSDNENIQKFIIFYPKDLNEEKYPVVLWANGTGSTSSTYTAFFEHLASWGFIVVGNDDKNTRTGESLNAGIDLLLSENKNSDSILYQKIDLENIGIGGHSQGGPAVFNMAVKEPHADMIKTVYAVSPTSSYHTNIYKDGWEYDLSKIPFQRL